MESFFTPLATKVEIAPSNMASVIIEFHLETTIPTLPSSTTVFVETS
jgi:hypothetical protein